jgi:hypothetical protein
MPRRVNPIVSAVVVMLVFALITLGISGRVFAGGECMEQPDREATQGVRWYYHYDREKGRKCWHPGTAATRPREVAPSQERSDAVATPTIASVFSSLFKGWPTPPPTSAPLNTIGEPRIIQSNPTKPLRLDDIAQQQPDIPEERADPRYTPPLNSAQRILLFQEYVRWEEIQRNLGTVGPPARSPSSAATGLGATK